jgi:hypothetical protein
VATPLIPVAPLAVSAEHATVSLRESMQRWPHDMECERSLLLPMVPMEPLPIVYIARAFAIPTQREAPVGRHRADI